MPSPPPLLLLVLLLLVVAAASLGIGVDTLRVVEQNARSEESSLAHFLCDDGEVGE